MEVFEVKKRSVERQSSSSSSRGHSGSKVGYVLAMAGIILFTSVFLVVLHFTREYSNLTAEIGSAEETLAERLEGDDEEPERCEEEPFCNTRECVSIAATMLESMNSKIDPCTDFYGYACGRYPRVKEVPYGMDFYSPLKDAQLRVLIDIRKTMDGSPLESESFLEQRMRRFYASCMNITERNDVENRTLTNWFEMIGIARSHLAIEGDLDQGYVFDSTLDFDNIMHWKGMVAKLEEYGIHTIFKPQFVEKEGSAPNKMEIHCQMPFLKPEAYLSSSNDQLAYQRIMYRQALNEVLELLKLNRQERSDFINEIFKLETDIATVIQNNENSEESTSSVTEEITDDDLALLNSIWHPVLGSALQDIQLVPVCGGNFRNILSVLHDAGQKRVVKYVFWRMLMQLAPHLGTDFRGIHLHYMTKLPGTEYAYESTWKQCADVVRTELGMAATKMLMDNGYFKREIIDAVNGQFLEIKRNIALIYSSIVEVDERIYKRFLDKLKNMKLEMGFPDIFSQNEENWLNAYDGWVIHDDDHLMNVINLKTLKWRKYLNRLWFATNRSFTDDDTFRFHPVSRISLDDNPLGSTSSYDYLKNTVHADLGLFRAPLYVHSENVPNYLDYGYSSILAREMVKAFDLIGTFYDAEGHKIEKILWPTFMEQLYDNTLSCIRNQTLNLKDAITVDIDNIQTLNNIIVDAGSFGVPFQGLTAHLRSHLNEKPLPGVPLTKKQTFFLQRAQMFCELRDEPSSDPEDQFKLPPKYRVNRAIANIPDFGETFNCPADSPMISELNCNLLQRAE